MGYALAAGRLLSRDEETIVASAPRFVVTLWGSFHQDVSTGMSEFN